MNNADKPINPIFNNHGGITHESHIKDSSLIGLTKREYFAGLAMQGLCALSIIGSHRIPINLIKEAIEYADELLKQLENNK